MEFIFLGRCGRKAGSVVDVLLLSRCCRGFWRKLSGSDSVRWEELRGGYRF